MRGTRGRHFLDAMAAPDEAPVQPPQVAVSTPAMPACDASADAGTKHYWPDGAVVGDWCLCGKRKRFTPFPPKVGA
jgi:hypothetical protein